MNSTNRRKRNIIILIAILIIFVFAIVFFVKSCDQKENNNPTTSVVTLPYSKDIIPLEPIEGVEAEIIDLDSFDRSEYEVLPDIEFDCSFLAKLLIADGPGIPIKKSIIIDANDIGISYQNTQEQKPMSLEGNNILIPSTTPPPSSAISVLKPVENANLLAGSKYELAWTVESDKLLIFDIMFSSDGGKTFRTIVSRKRGILAYELIVPNEISNKCVFRVSAFDGDTFFGYNDSPMFNIVENLVITIPEAPLIPLPDFDFPSVPIPLYVEDENIFINELGDTSRYFYIEHSNTSVNSMTWQVSRYPFDCDPALELGPLSGGLLAYGELTAESNEFILDFKAIISKYKVVGEEEPGNEDTNKGVEFNIIPDQKLQKQKQYDLYIRVTLYDDLKNVIGVTKSDFKVVYGSPNIQVNINDDEFTSQFKQPYILVRDEPGFEYGSWITIPDQGLFLKSGDSLDRRFALEDTPREDVEIDFQISTVPFKSVTESDYQQPSGLVYQEEAFDILLGHYGQYDVPMADFMPSQSELGDRTVWYFMRAVCYVLNEATGEVVPITTKTYRITYTGNLGIYLAGVYDQSEMPPEEVEVKSYVPETDFLRYEPARWAIADAHEYFEVTRPIQAEEMCFYIKNNKTGDFLYPYVTHMQKYPNTTRAEYQNTLDRMLPVGAWFRLTITKSGWDSFWDEFSDLATQWYNQIREAYNGSQDDIANTVANQFEFLGPDMQNVIRKGTHLAIDYCLAYVGLPPELPNMEELTKQGIDYAVYIALEEAAEAYGVPIDEIPPEVREAIVERITEEIVEIESMKHINPLGVDYLKPATKAMYVPGYIELNIRNTHDKPSPNGSFTVSYRPRQQSHNPIYISRNIYIPSIPANDSLRFRIYLKHGGYGTANYEELFNGLKDECKLVIYGNYNVPDVDTLAAEQGVTGESSINPDSFYFDIDPSYHYSRINVPREGFWD